MRIYADLNADLRRDFYVYPRYYLRPSAPSNESGQLQKI